MFPLLGFSINTLSMFGLVLAIGLVVDDAIVVVEGVQRHIEEGLQSKGRGSKSDGRAFRPGHWYRPRSVVRFCADSFHPGHHGKAVSAVRADHRHIGGTLRVQCAHA